MDDSKLNFIEEKVPFVGDHRFGFMIIVSIIITFIMTGVGLYLYNSSGAAQLDLSRPGYNDVRDKIDKSDDFDNFSSVGVMDIDVYENFKKIYTDRATKIKSAEAFSGDPLSPVALGFELYLSD